MESPTLYRMPETAVDLIEDHCLTLRQDHPIAEPISHKLVDEHYRDDLKEILGSKATFSNMMRTQGEAYREPEGTGAQNGSV